MLHEEVFHTKCTPGNECRMTVENSIKIEGIEVDMKEIKEDVKDIRKEIKTIVYGVAASVILILLNWVWQLAT